MGDNSTAKRLRRRWPILIICCGLCLFVPVAIVVVASLIPTYLSRSDFATRNTGLCTIFAFHVNLMHSTNVKSTDVSQGPGVTDLTTKLMQQYPSATIETIKTLFIASVSTSASKKRRNTVTKMQECTTYPGTSGDFLYISFVIKRRNACVSNGCLKAFNETLQKISTALRLNTALLLTMANGSTVTAQVAFCSFNQVQLNIKTTPKEFLTGDDERMSYFRHFGAYSILFFTLHKVATREDSVCHTEYSLSNHHECATPISTNTTTPTTVKISNAPAVTAGQTVTTSTITTTTTLALCQNGVQDTGETDIDCGGSTTGCSKCADTKNCLVGSDCVNNKCSANKCVPLCQNGVQDTGETDVDCGGSTTGCSKCADTESCLVDSDCVNNKCPSNKCVQCVTDGDCTGGQTCQANVCAAPSCFCGDQNVMLHDGTARSMDKLQPGDLVWTLSDDGKMFSLTEVMIISHREENLTAIFYTVETITGHRISLSNIHYIRVQYFGYLTPQELTLNHSVYVANIGPVRIRSITIELKLGAYNPLTLSGTILVNNILASVYSKNKLKGTHYTKHRIFAPYRWWYSFAKYYLGFENVYETPSNGNNRFLRSMTHEYGHVVYLIYQITQAFGIILLVTVIMHIIPRMAALKHVPLFR
ncbi:unnamed protein product [Adineta ricciae]|uniref:Hedgehog protein Hint domain-containing protein n=1 Tax=Adineta ricciae TaxID=249248 RepID=A0A814AP98_ADIRI|nr:unnamed protein product [Adineta ricciae]